MQPVPPQIGTLVAQLHGTTYAAAQAIAAANRPPGDDADAFARRAVRIDRRVAYPAPMHRALGVDIAIRMRPYGRIVNIRSADAFFPVRG
ncbi:hypothetical protein DIE14_24360 [Burkholderia sp. Bp9017]|nr:hypothetical protein DIE14_24360 [Burkholderia sp. Bp9017]